MKRAYQIPLDIDPTGLPWTFDGERSLTVPGDGYVEVDGSIDGYTEVPVRIAAASVGKTQFAPLEYMERFTDDEQLAIVAATMASAAVKLWYDKMLAASYVDISDPRVATGLDALIAAGLLQPDRKAVLLGAQV